MTSAATMASIQHEPALAGQIVVVIGGSAGIGLETARRARAEGAEVILTGRDPERLKQAGQHVGASASPLSTPKTRPRCRCSSASFRRLSTT